MAVKPERIKVRLKALFPKANLSQKRIDAIADRLSKKPADDADDNAVDEVINEANELYPFEDIAKDDDRLRTLEEKAKQPASPAPDPEPNKDKPSKDEDEAPAWAKTMMQEVKELKEGKIVENKQSLAKKALEESKELPDSLKAKWLNRVDINSEVSFEDQVKELEQEYNDLRQNVADNADLADGAPTRAFAKTEFSVEEATKIVDDIL